MRRVGEGAVVIDEIKERLRSNRILGVPYRVLRFARHAPARIDAILGRRRYDQRRIDGIFARRIDPWNYERSVQALERRDLILAQLPRPSYARMLEIGCAEGWMTPALASRADEVTAIDISAVALGRARARCADLPQIVFREHDIITQTLPGPFEAIICAGVLCYVPRPQQAWVGEAIIQALERGGDLLLEHKREADAGEMAGREVHRAFAQDARLQQLSHEERDCYAITVFRRR